MAFSFAIEVETREDPAPASVQGSVFEDANENGRRDPEEGGWHGGVLRLTLPSGITWLVMAHESDAFRFLVDNPGLYRLELQSIVDRPVCFTTPNPLEIVLSSGVTGELESFEQACFGAHDGECSRP